MEKDWENVKVRKYFFLQIIESFKDIFSEVLVCFEVNLKK